MEVQASIREFKYNGVALNDPGAQFSLEQVREFYATLYPEIVNASIEGPTTEGNKVVYEFRRAVGTKGAASLRDRLVAAAAGQVDRPSPLSHAFDLDGHQQLARAVANCLDMQRSPGAVAGDAALLQAPAELLAPLP